MSNPLVLITGVTGFVAQHVVGATLQAGYRVRGLVRQHNVYLEFPHLFAGRSVMVQSRLHCCKDIPTTLKQQLLQMLLAATSVRL